MKLQTPITITDQKQKQFTFNSTDELKDFFNNQADFWNSQTSFLSSHSSHYIQKHSEFRIVANKISAWEPDFETWDANTLSTNLSPIIANFSNSSWLWSTHPFIKKWQELNPVSTNTADAFFEAIVSNASSRFASGFDYFQGYLIAYEFINQGKTNLNKRRASEDKALAELREQLTTKSNELIGNVSEFESEITKWKVETESGFANWFENQVTFLDEAVLSHSKNFHEQLSNWTQEKTNLENKYQEKLRLEPSAQYWTTSANNLNIQGRNWARALVLSVLLGFITFAIFFICWLKGDKTALSLQSLEGAILFATILSCYAFLLKSISKAMFSSFHLQRVSEESALLTNLYLSLKEGKDDDPDSRKIVLQALFSRSETGLLANESGPTMPTAAEFINIIKQK